MEFEDSRDAEDAVYELNGKDLCGERVIVEHARGPRRDRDGYSYSSRSECCPAAVAACSGRAGQGPRWGGGRWVGGLVGREGGQEAGAAQALGREGPAYLALGGEEGVTGGVDRDLTEWRV